MDRKVIVEPIGKRFPALLPRDREERSVAQNRNAYFGSSTALPIADATNEYFPRNDAMRKVERPSTSSSYRELTHIRPRWSGASMTPSPKVLGPTIVCQQLSRPRWPLRRPSLKPVQNISTPECQSSVNEGLSRMGRAHSAPSANLLRANTPRKHTKANDVASYRLPKYLKVSRKNLRPQVDDSRKRTLPSSSQSSVANYMHNDIAEKNFEVIDNLDDKAVSHLVKNVMCEVNKRYGQELEKDLKEYLGEKQYMEIAQSSCEKIFPTCAFQSKKLRFSGKQTTQIFRISSDKKLESSTMTSGQNSKEKLVPKQRVNQDLVINPRSLVNRGRKALNIGNMDDANKVNLIVTQQDENVTSNGFLEVDRIIEAKIASLKDHEYSFELEQDAVVPAKIFESLEISTKADPKLPLTTLPPRILFSEPGKRATVESEGHSITAKVAPVRNVPKKHLDTLRDNFQQINSTPRRTEAEERMRGSERSDNMQRKLEMLLNRVRGGDCTLEEETIDGAILEELSNSKSPLESSKIPSHVATENAENQLQVFCLNNEVTIRGVTQSSPFGSRFDAATKNSDFLEITALNNPHVNNTHAHQAMINSGQKGVLNTGRGTQQKIRKIVEKNILSKKLLNDNFLRFKQLLKSGGSNTEKKSDNSQEVVTPKSIKIPPTLKMFSVTDPQIRYKARDSTPVLQKNLINKTNKECTEKGESQQLQESSKIKSQQKENFNKVFETLNSFQINGLEVDRRESVKSTVKKEHDDAEKIVNYAPPVNPPNPQSAEITETLTMFGAKKDPPLERRKSAEAEIVQYDAEASVQNDEFQSQEILPEPDAENLISMTKLESVEIKKTESEQPSNVVEDQEIVEVLNSSGGETAVIKQGSYIQETPRLFENNHDHLINDDYSSNICKNPNRETECSTPQKSRISSTEKESPDLEQSMDELKKLLDSFKDGDERQTFTKWSSTTSSDSFESFSQKVMPTLQRSITYEEGSSDLEQSVSALSQLLLDLPHSSASSKSEENCTLYSANFGNKDCPKVNVEICGVDGLCQGREDVEVKAGDRVIILSDILLTPGQESVKIERSADNGKEKRFSESVLETSSLEVEPASTKLRKENPMVEPIGEDYLDIPRTGTPRTYSRAKLDKKYLQMPDAVLHAEKTAQNASLFAKRTPKKLKGRAALKQRETKVYMEILSRLKCIQKGFCLAERVNKLHRILRLINPIIPPFKNRFTFEARTRRIRKRSARKRNSEVRGVRGNRFTRKNRKIADGKVPTQFKSKTLKVEPLEEEKLNPQVNETHFCLDLMATDDNQTIPTNFIPEVIETALCMEEVASEEDTQTVLDSPQHVTAREESAKSPLYMELIQHSFDGPWLRKHTRELMAKHPKKPTGIRPVKKTVKRTYSLRSRYIGIRKFVHESVECDTLLYASAVDCEYFRLCSYRPLLLFDFSLKLVKLLLS